MGRARDRGNDPFRHEASHAKARDPGGLIRSGFARRFEGELGVADEELEWLCVGNELPNVVRLAWLGLCEDRDAEYKPAPTPVSTTALMRADSLLRTPASIVCMPYPRRNSRELRVS